jgi:hypothetical protein
MFKTIISISSFVQDTKQGFLSLNLDFLSHHPPSKNLLKTQNTYNPCFGVPIEHYVKYTVENHKFK